MLEFTFNSNNGQELKSDLNGVREALALDGIDVQNFSQDGMMAYIQSPEGVQPMPVDQLLRQNGYELSGIRPENVNEDFAEPQWRFFMGRLNSDVQRQTFLKSELESKGVVNPSIVGSGQEWYGFDPQSNQWYALTNKKGADFSDVAEYGPEILKDVAGVAGATIGVGLGAPTGPGAIATGFAGATAGAAGTEALLQGAGAINPNFREAQNLGDFGAKLGKEGISRGIFGALGGAGRYGAEMLPKLGAEEVWKRGLAQTAKTAGDFLGNGIASKTARGAGSIMNATGDLASGVARTAADSPLATSLITTAVPGLGQAQMAGFLGQAPKWIIESMGKAPKWTGEKLMSLGRELDSPMLRKAGANSWLEGKSLLRPSQRTGVTGFEKELREGASVLKPMTTKSSFAQEFLEPNSIDVLSNVGERAGRGIVQGKQFLKGQMAKPGEVVQPLTEEALSSAGRSGAAIGQKIGTISEQMANIGSGVEKGAEAVTKAGLRGIQYGASGLSGTGRVLKNVGAMTEPFENQILSRMGAEELYQKTPDALEKLKRRMDPTQIPWYER